MINSIFKSGVSGVRWLFYKTSSHAYIEVLEKHHLMPLTPLIKKQTVKVIGSHIAKLVQGVGHVTQ